MMYYKTKLTIFVVIIPIFWRLEDSQHESGSQSIAQLQDDQFSSPGLDEDEDSRMAEFNESDERFQSYSNEGESEDLSLVPTSYVPRRCNLLFSVYYKPAF
jgi:hypothetical protein